MGVFEIFYFNRRISWKPSLKPPYVNFKIDRGQSPSSVVPTYEVRWHFFRGTFKLKIDLTYYFLDSAENHEFNMSIGHAWADIKECFQWPFSTGAPMKYQLKYCNYSKTHLTVEHNCSVLINKLLTSFMCLFNEFFWCQVPTVNLNFFVSKFTTMWIFIYSICWW